MDGAWKSDSGMSDAGMSDSGMSDAGKSSERKLPAQFGGGRLTHRLGWVLAIGLAVAWSSQGARESLLAQPGPVRSMSTDSLVVVPTSEDGATQAIAVIDPQLRSMGVYQIDRASGEITLRSVRSIRWDLQMEEFNTSSPKPKEIRALSQPR